MKHIVRSLVAAVVLNALALGLDWLFFRPAPLGLWAYTLAALVGMVLALLGIIICLSAAFVREKGGRLAAGASLMLAGAMTFILAWLLWLALGLPSPS